MEDSDAGEKYCGGGEIFSEGGAFYSGIGEKSSAAPQMHLQLAENYSSVGEICSSLAA